MRVRKRSGEHEAVDVNKIVNAVARCAEGLLGVDPMRVATRTISALADGAVSDVSTDHDGIMYTARGRVRWCLVSPSR